MSDADFDEFADAHWAMETGMTEPTTTAGRRLVAMAEGWQRKIWLEHVLAIEAEVITLNPARDVIGVEPVSCEGFPTKRYRP